MADREFFFGSHLCREPMPAMSELKRDMGILRDRGFNLVKLQEHWMVDEPAEGDYDFSRYEELIEHAAGLEMKVYLGLTCEQAPHWLWEKHPDCRMVFRNGLPLCYEAPTTLPADGKPGPCYDHPGAREDMCRFITRLVEALGAHENLAYWNTWQEIGYWSEVFAGGHACYCPHTLAHWRRWLRDEHGDLDALNRAWRTRYRSWSDIQPERGVRMPTAQEVAFRTFMDNVQIAEVLRVRAEAIRRADPLGRPVFAHKAAPAIGAGQDWTYARCQDFVGDTTPRLEEASRIGLALQRHADVFAAASTPQADVAILIDEQNYQLCTSLSQGGENLAYSVRGWHRLLWEAGAAVDFVEVSELSEAHVNDYKMLILPFPLSLSEAVAERLAAWVAKGGALVCEACPGRIDETAFCNRGELSPKMAELFGVRQESFTQVREPDGQMRWTPQPRTCGEILDATMLDGAGPLAGRRLRANVYIETYRPHGGEPVLHYGGAVAGTVRTVGAGRAWLLGTFVGHNGTAHRDAETRAAVQHLLDLSGVAVHRAGDLLIRRRVIEGKQAWLLTNPTDREATGVIPLEGMTLADDLLGDAVVARDASSVTVRVPPVNVSCIILEDA